MLSCLWEEHLLLIGKFSLSGGSGFPLSLSEWSFTICLTPYNRKQNVLSVSLNRTFPSFQKCNIVLEAVSCSRLANMYCVHYQIQPKCKANFNDSTEMNNHSTIFRNFQPNQEFISNIQNLKILVKN